MAWAVGLSVSSRALPSLATVAERRRPTVVKNLDWRNDDGLASGFRAPAWWSWLFSLLLVEEEKLLMRKKFLSFCGKWLEPLRFLVDGMVGASPCS